MTKTHKQKPGRGNSLVFFVVFYYVRVCELGEIKYDC